MVFHRVCRLGFCLAIVVIFSGCGIVRYPGQPGMVTHNFNKIDLEYLDEPGLFVYETVYDNRVGGSGVGAVVTKLYPQAKTYTSNVRTNADGTLFRNKTEYEGAEVQMISVPNLGQVHLSPNHQLFLFVDYATSLDENDDQNLAESSLFKASSTATEILPRGLEIKKMRWDLLRAGKLLTSGGLAYEVTSLEMKQIKFVPSQPVQVETSFFGNAVKAQLTTQVKTELVQFIDTNFPKGFSGAITLNVKGATEPLTISLGVNTVKTLETAGIKIVKDASEHMLQEIKERFKAGTKEGESK